MMRPREWVFHSRSGYKLVWQLLSRGVTQTMGAHADEVCRWCLQSLEGMEMNHE
jgi:hypothetical protein